MIFNEEEDAGDNDGDFLWSCCEPHDVLLPVGISSAFDSDKTVHVCSDTMSMKLWFTPRDGTVGLCLVERGEHGDWGISDATKELAYLELHCPWPQT